MALPLADVREVLPLPELGAGPGQPPFVAGHFILDGEVALVLRLGQLLGLADSPPDFYAPLIRLRADGIGPTRLLLVDRVETVLAAPVCEPAPPEDSFNGCVLARFAHAGRLVHVLDRHRLLLTEEAAAARAFAGVLAERLAALADGDAR